MVICDNICKKYLCEKFYHAWLIDVFFNSVIWFGFIHRPAVSKHDYLFFLSFKSLLYKNAYIPLKYVTSARIAKYF